MAAFPLSFDSLLRGMKAISFVASKMVYFEALLSSFGSQPRATLSMRGVDANECGKPIQARIGEKNKEEETDPVSKDDDWRGLGR